MYLWKMGFLIRNLRMWLTRQLPAALHHCRHPPTKAGPFTLKLSARPRTMMLSEGRSPPKRYRWGRSRTRPLPSPNSSMRQVPPGGGRHEGQREARAEGRPSTEK